MKMSKNDIKLVELPDVLQDLVLLYAFNLPKQQVLESLGVILDIVDMKLPFFFFREKIFLAEPCFLVHAHRILQRSLLRAVRRRCNVLFASGS
jgi:hypothetical protein